MPCGLGQMPLATCKSKNRGSQGGGSCIASVATSSTLFAFDSSSVILCEEHTDIHPALRSKEGCVAHANVACQAQSIITAPRWQAKQAVSTYSVATSLMGYDI